VLDAEGESYRVSRIDVSPVASAVPVEELGMCGMTHEFTAIGKVMRTTAPTPGWLSSAMIGECGGR
jgi:hypothetical protein